MQTPFWHGINYPWTIDRSGKSNYGCDFGRNIWNTHSGVSTRVEDVGHDFAAIAALGFRVVRWFLFCDGRGGIEWSDDGVPLRLADGFFDDMDAALDIASKNNLQIVFPLLDYLFLADEVKVPERGLTLHAHSSVLTTEVKRTALIKNIFSPVLRRYGNSPGVLAWEVMNEPDWVVAGLDPNPAHSSNPLPLREFKRFVRDVVGVIHATTKHLAAVGGGRVKLVRVWDDDDLQLDFLQAHAYNDFMNTNDDARLFGTHCSHLGLKRPLVIGEFSPNAGALGKNLKTPDPIPAESYLSFAVSHGYAGAWPWSFNAVDALGCPEYPVLQQWALDCADELKLRNIS